MQKREAREGLDRDMTLPTTLQQLYGMEVVELSPTELEAFRQKTRPVYNKWASEIGVELVPAVTPAPADHVIEDLPNEGILTQQRGWPQGVDRRCDALLTGVPCWHGRC